MGSDTDVENTTGAADVAECKPARVEDFVGPVAEKMLCSLAQARLSLDAVFASIKEAPQPLQIRGVGTFTTSKSNA